MVSMGDCMKNAICGDWPFWESPGTIENGTTRQINAHFRANDESHLWPICNKFNATERAIRRLRRAGGFYGGPCYFLALDREISLIVNGEI